MFLNFLLIYLQNYGERDMEIKHEKYYVDFMSITKQISRQYVISIILMGMSVGWWIFLQGILDIVFNKNTYWITISFFLIIIIYLATRIFENRNKSKLIYIYRGIILIFLLIPMSNLLFPSLDDISITIYTVSYLFQQSIEVIKLRVDRSSQFTSTYSHNHSNKEIMILDTKYLDDRSRWLYTTHIIILVFAFILILLIRFFNLIFSIQNNKYILFTGFGAIILLVIIMLKRLYMPLIIDINANNDKIT